MNAGDPYILALRYCTSQDKWIGNTLNLPLAKPKAWGETRTIGHTGRTGHARTKSSHRFGENNQAEDLNEPSGWPGGMAYGGAGEEAGMAKGSPEAKTRPEALALKTFI